MKLHQYVIDSARANPTAPAVGSADGLLDYGTLDRRADAVARRLLLAGAGPGERVVILSGKSGDCVVAMQAVLRCGAAYVPVDSATPARRLADIVADCRPILVICENALIPDLDRPAGVPVLPLTAESDRMTVDRADFPSQPDDPAYILYTSGSTGTPKGVCISHRNAISFVDWAVAELGATAQDRFSSHAPFGFDLSVLDLYGAFAAGASVHLIPRMLAYAPAELVAYLVNEQISIWYSVPSALVLMMTNGGLLETAAPSALRAVLFAGEPFPIGFVRELAAWTPARLLNLYGPTETNVCTFHEVRPEDLEREQPVPIGRPASGDTVEVRAPDGSVCPPGTEGEVVVGGPTVMLGYWGAEPAGQEYHTGDRAVRRPDGALDYRGRRDHMVKIRGHRIELGDVEAALDSHPGVESSAVVVAGEGMSATLVAFVIPAGTVPPGLVALKAHLAGRLPTSMTIDRLHRVPALPRSENGKVDRKALLARHFSRARASVPETVRYEEKSA